MLNDPPERPRWGPIVLILVALIFLVPPVIVAIAPDRPVPVAVPLAWSGTYRVYVADWGYHTSIILQQPATWQLEASGMERAPYVEYAWGDRRFYMESNYRPDAVFATLFLPTASVEYVADWRADPLTGHPRALYFRDIDENQLRALAESLEGAIRRDQSGNRPQPYPTVSGYSGRFYPAHGAYLWSYDCNRWTVERLAAAHLARGGAGVVFSGQVAGHLLGFRRVAARPATAPLSPNE